MESIKLSKGVLSFTEKTLAYNAGDDRITLVLSKITCIAFGRRANARILINGLVLGLIVMFGGGYLADSSGNQDIFDGIVITGILIFVVAVVLYFVLIQRTLAIKSPSGEIRVSGRYSETLIAEIEDEVLKRI